MKRMISPSLMCADFMNLGDELKKLEKGNIEYLHVDIMDGVYVPNYTLGTDFVKPATCAQDIQYPFLKTGQNTLQKAL